jgi:hypothetical protein
MLTDHKNYHSSSKNLPTFRLWTLKEHEKSRVTAAEMDFFFLKTAEHTHTVRPQKESRHGRTENRASQFEKINWYKREWTQHAGRMDRCRLPCAVRRQKPAGKRSGVLGRCKNWRTDRCDAEMGWGRGASAPLTA